MDSAPCITVITGPLGAGKTTLLNRWLRSFERGEAAVIVNEFGDVGVDGEILRACGIESCPEDANLRSSLAISASARKFIVR